MIKEYQLNLLIILIFLFAMNSACKRNKSPLEVIQDKCTNIRSDERTFLGLGEETVTAIAIHPSNPEIIFVGSARDFSEEREGKIFKSMDCGETWDTLFVGGTITRIIIDPSSPNIIYANPHGIVRSTNGGKLWTNIDNGLDLDWETSVISLEVGFNNSGMLYAGTGGFGLGYLYYTDDHGNSWQPIPGYKDFERTVDDNKYLHNNVISLAISPKNPDVVYAGTARRSHLLRSNDKGMTWRKIELLDVGRGVVNIFFSPDFNRLYVQVGGYGLYKTDLMQKFWEEILIPDNLKHGDLKSMVFNETGHLIMRTSLGIYKHNNAEWLDYTDNLVHRYTTSIGIGINNN